MWMNRLKTLILLSALSGLLLFIGGLFGGHTGLAIACVMAFTMNFIAYFFSEKIVLTMYGAQQLDKNQYGWIYEVVEELAHTMQIPMPKLWIVKNPMANAFATGRSPAHASVAVTTGILNLLDKDELRGVLAHELSHIKNRDVLVTTIAATLATAIGYLASMLHHAAFWGAISGNNERKRGGGNLIAMLAIAILMPFAAMLIQMAISRSREYLADETGAHNCHDPLALASALEKLHHHIPHAHMNNDDTARASTAGLFIVHPFTAGTLMSLFSTHPPMHKRVERLRAMHEKMFKYGA
jgi:heat shock protein HtpX